MNGRITLEPTPSKRLTALAISVLWKRFKEFRNKPTTSKPVLDTAYLEQFLDYADLDLYMEIAFAREELLIRIDESKKNQDRYRRQKLEDDVVEATKKVHDLKL